MTANFLRICAGLDVTPLLLELALAPELWNANTVRTFHEQSAHRVIDDIVLRYNRFDAGDDFVDAVCSRIEVENYPAYARLFQARLIVNSLMARVNGEHLGRVFISRMSPGVCIPPHTDRIAVAEEAFPDRIPPACYYDRYHICLQSAPGVVFRCGEESVYMAPGDVWWFQNLEEHEVLNNSGAERIHLVCDIHTYKQDYTPTPQPEGRTH